MYPALKRRAIITLPLRGSSDRDYEAALGGHGQVTLPALLPNSRNRADLVLAGKRDACRISRSCVGGRPRANSAARANGILPFRSRAILTSCRSDHLEWRHSVSTKACVVAARTIALTMEASVNRGFSSAACITRASASTSSAPATRPDPRWAEDPRTRNGRCTGHQCTRRPCGNLDVRRNRRRKRHLHQIERVEMPHHGQ